MDQLIAQNIEQYHPRIIGLPYIGRFFQFEILYRGQPYQSTSSVFLEGFRAILVCTRKLLCANMGDLNLLITAFNRCRLDSEVSLFDVNLIQL